MKRIILYILISLFICCVSKNQNIGPRSPQEMLQRFDTCIIKYSKRYTPAKQYLVPTFNPLLPFGKMGGSAYISDYSWINGLASIRVITYSSQEIYMPDHNFLNSLDPRQDYIEYLNKEWSSRSRPSNPAQNIWENESSSIRISYFNDIFYAFDVSARPTNLEEIYEQAFQCIDQITTGKPGTETGDRH